MKKKVLVIGPSMEKAKGGMTTVIKEMYESDILVKDYEINIHASYRDGTLFYRLFYSIYAFIKFLLIYKKYDIFHIHMASYGSTFRKGIYLKVLEKKKILLHIHGAEYLKFYNNSSIIKKKIIYSIWKKANVIVVLSAKWKEEFDIIFKNLNIVIINNGININNLKVGMSDIVKTKDNFLLLGRLGKRKGVYDVLTAIEQLNKEYPFIKVYLAGDGEIEKVKKIIEEKKLSLNIEVLGWINQKKKNEILKKVSTILLPAYNEGLPMSILEGMAIGKMIITSRVGAIPEVVIEGENGILISAGNIKQLKEAIERVINNEDNFLRKYSKNNIKKIRENFSVEVMHHNILDIYNKNFSE